MNALPLPVLTVGGGRPDPHANSRRRSVLRAEPARDAAPEAAGPRAVRLAGPGARRRGAPDGAPASASTGSTSAVRASASSASSTCSRRRSADDGDGVVVMLQERTIADKMDRQLTHRGAARSITALGAHAGPRDQEPALRHPRRGAAAGAIGRRGRPRADAADLRRDRPDREARRAHGAVRRRAAPSSGARSTSTACSTM